MAQLFWLTAPFVATFLLLLPAANSAGVSSPLQTKRDRGFPLADSESSQGWTNANANAADGAHRLPTSIIPSLYSLTIVPVLDRDDPVLGHSFGTAIGNIDISIECVDVTDSITLHAFRQLVAIDEGSVKVTHSETNEEFQVIGFDYVEEYSFFTIQLSNDLVLGQAYNLHIDFNTTIATDRLNGLYMSRYLTPGESEPNLIAVTTFAPSAARQAFPCFDEPALKATYQLTIGRKEGFISLSNTELEVSDPGRFDGWVYDSFARTVRMSSYLVIIFVAQYGHKEAEVGLPGGKPVRIYAPPYMIEKGGADYASGVAQNVMTYFEEYLDVEYKLSKYDSAAIPDFMYNAMENYGLVTYWTPILMYFNGETREAERKRIATVMAHESAHHWFGNLITMRWWNQVWLKEGFASYLAPIGVKHTDPEFEPEQAFQNDVFQFSMPFDSDPAYAHPILSPDSNPAPLYDRMNYEKAACMIRMMEGFLTSETLRRGLHEFLTKYEFQAVGQNELFEVLHEVWRDDDDTADVRLDGLSLKSIMDTWTQQAGFPLVRVHAGADRVYISQERFVPLQLDPLDQRDLNANELWTIPITIATASNPDFTTYVPKFWLMKDQQLVTLLHNTNEWIMLNVDGRAYYRVLYDRQLTNAIIAQLQADFQIISPQSRSQLIDDYFKSAAVFHVSIETALDLTTYLGSERDPHVWDTVLTNLEPIYNMFMGGSSEQRGLDALSAYLVPKLEAVINELGIDQLSGDKGNKVLHRLQLLDWTCGMGSELCVNHAQELFNDWQVDPDNPSVFIPLDLQPVIFCAAVANDDSATVPDFMLERYLNPDTLPYQKPYLLNALARFVFQRD